MSAKKITTYKQLGRLANRLRDDLNNPNDGGKNFILLYAHNGTGKTRLSTEFKNTVKKKANGEAGVLYFNAFTEDLFSWDNDLEGDSERALIINANSNFFSGFQQLELEQKVFDFLKQYADFSFSIDYDSRVDKKWAVRFSRDIEVRGHSQTVENIKVSRGEENLFIWCVYLAFCQLVVDGDESYSWVKYLYIDDPISSLDDNNAIAVASHLSQILCGGNGRVKTVISSHHILFFNVICNELKKEKCNQYFLHKNSNEGYALQKTDDTPFFHHVAVLSELQSVKNSGKIYTHHFNALRSILEKTATFFGHDDFSACIHGVEDEILFTRALNLLSHGSHSVYAPAIMTDDNKKLFTNILESFLAEYHFSIPELIKLNHP